MTSRRKSLAVLTLLVPMIGIAGSTAAGRVGNLDSIAPTMPATSRVPGTHHPNLLSSIELPQPTGWATWFSAVIAVAFVVRRKSNWQ
ncbi:MAG TPA: hypothetical protein VE046_01365 [Steroidobacteraceae bacterium]|nr:hypothetical protein [Steroidobacteraceae bacterium]